MEWGTPVWWGWFLLFSRSGVTRQKKPTPLDRGPPLHVNRVLVIQKGIVVVQNNGKERQKSALHVQIFFLLIRSIDLDATFITVPV